MYSWHLRWLLGLRGGERVEVMRTCVAKVQGGSGRVCFASDLAAVGLQRGGVAEMWRRACFFRWRVFETGKFDSYTWRRSTPVE